jgi:hypothetical protein
MASFPTLRSGKVSMYGTEQTYKIKTEVVKFMNGAEQRWKVAPRLFEGTLAFVRINGYDRGLVQAFVNSMKGQKDFTWDLTIDGSLWSYMTFLEDEIQWSSRSYDRYDGRIACRQTRIN